MNAYKPVRSSRDISKYIADYLEMCAPLEYPPMDRAAIVGTVNDILQGRTERSVEDLLTELQEKGGNYGAGKIAAICRDIQAYQEQKAMLAQPYTKTSDKAYKYRTMDLNPEQPLKMINQQTYDRAAKAGFPPDFFRESYFYNVIFYCLPDRADFNFSRFEGCTFAVCRIKGAQFDGASIISSEFHDCTVDHTTFFHTSLAYTHFYDCNFQWVSFQLARLRRCNTTDCQMDNVSFLGATLDGCSYGRVTPVNIRHLDTATITQSGSTAEECKHNRASVFKALGVPVPPEHNKQHRLPGRER